MKILQINSVYGIRSTGRIVTAIEKLLDEAGFEHCAITGEGDFSDPHVYVMSGRFYQKANVLLTRIFGRHGFYNKWATKRALKFIDKEKPDLIHLHNLHGHYINAPLLFNYIREKKIPLVWSLHDCWAFTGHCPHFDYIGCEKWKTGCYDCPQQKGYPGSWFFDRSKKNYREKKALFTSIPDIHFVLASKWLESKVKESFFGNYPSCIIMNGVDTNAFYPRETNLKEKLGLSGKFVIMGIIREFSGPKGGEFFLKLSEMLKEDEHIVLVSLEEKPENIPPNITALPTTDSKEKLAEIYSMADVFVNTTLQETLPTVNTEAICCNTPVVSFDSGGCSETVDETCGILVPRGDAQALYAAVQRVRKGELSMEGLPTRRETLDNDARFRAHIDLYSQILSK